MEMEHVTHSLEPVYARLGGVDHVVIAPALQAPGVLTALILANAEMEQDATMKQVSEIALT